MAETITVYKIRDKKTGLFSRGGVNPLWSEKGKTWNSLGALKNHMNGWSLMYLSTTDDKYRADWEIVELVYQVEETKSWPVSKCIEELKRRKLIQEKFGWVIENALRKMQDVDTNRYRYALQFTNYGKFMQMRRELKDFGLQRDDYRIRTPIIVFDNLEKAMPVKLTYGEDIEQFVDFVKLKKIEL